MRHFLILGAVLCAAQGLLLASCDRFQSWQDKFAGDAAASAEPAALTTDYGTTAQMSSTEEARRFAAHPGLATREGDVLKVFHEGAPVAAEKTVSCEHSSNSDLCRHPMFWGAVDLLSPRTGQIEAYAVLYIGFWESAGYYIPLENGRNVFLTGEPAASPDGRWLASGAEFFDEHGGDGGGFQIYDWAGGGKSVMFGLNCRPHQWRDDRSVTALCIDGNHARFEAIAERGEDGRWTLTPTRIVAVSDNHGAVAPRSRFEGVPVEGQL